MKLAPRARVSGLLLAVLCFGAPSARADEPSAADLTAATMLFQQGKASVDTGRYAEACRQFEAAQRLVAGVGVTLYLGDCYEQTGHLTRAWVQFDKAREMAEANDDDRARVARQRAERLWPRLSKVMLVVPPSADVAGLLVTEDGATVDRRAYNVERPVEPGTHRFRATAPGRQPWETSVEVLAPPASLHVEVPRLTAAEQASSAIVPAPAVVVPQPVERPVTPALTGAERSTRIPVQRVAGIAVFGLGVVGLTAGVIFGIQAKSRMDDSNASGHCRPNDHCDATGLAERSDALNKATLSTVGFVGGLACMAAGTVLYLTAHDQARATALAARAQRGGASLLLEGHW